MWRRLVNWYDAFENEQLAVLERPELAESIPRGLRGWNARRMAALPPLERTRMREFYLSYRGPRRHKALARWAALFTLIGVLQHLVKGDPGLVAAVIGANLVGFLLLAGAISLWFAPSEMFKSKRMTLGIVAAGIVSGPLGAFAGFMMAGGRSLEAIYLRLSELAWGGIVSGLVLYLPVLLIGAYRKRHLAAQAEQLQRDAERDRLARELSESQLRMLRAQIEPHFLFNTLGAVQQLAADGAPRAAALTADLIAFLRASFSDMRCEQLSLKTEFSTIESYLRVMQTRMGTRLRFELSLPDYLAHTPVPSMIVLTLVENAIKHGIEPALRGGDIRVTAEAEGGGVRICVHDSGIGMSATPGSGAGLDNVRRRLQLAYGEAAGLVLRDADPGLVAELIVPAALKEAA